MTGYDPEKALNVLAYVAERIPEQGNMYKVLKAIYLADKLHLNSYGRLIFFDRYQALDAGPTPAGAYDILTHVRDGKSQPRMPRNVRSRIRVDEHSTVHPVLKADTNVLSESELECLDRAIRFCIKHHWAAVKNKVHDAAYKKTKRNQYMSLESIAESLPNRDALLAHLKDPYPG